MENGKASARIAGEPQELPEDGKPEFIVVPVCVVAYFPREALDCLVKVEVEDVWSDPVWHCDL